MDGPMMLAASISRLRLGLMVGASHIVCFRE